MASIEIDADEYLSDVSDDALRIEVRHRIAAGWEIKFLDDGTEPWSKPGLAADLRAAFYSRNASRFELLLSVLEQREAS